MLIAKLNNCTVSITGAGTTMDILYPQRLMASNAYSFAWECCNRFNTESTINPDDGAPSIYVYGEMYKPSQFMNKLASIAEKIGAKVEVTN
jgi:hypothetical protein